MLRTPPPKVSNDSKSPLLPMSYGFGVGLLFGMALEKSKVYLPQVVRGQMLFNSWTMFKMFLTATAVGLVITANLEHYGFVKRVAKSQIIGLGFLKGYSGNILGGLILGVGMSISGACPGTVLAQVGAGVPTARPVLLGGLTAALSFGYFQKGMSEVTKGKFLTKQDSVLLDQWMGRSKMYEVSIAFAALLTGIIVLLNYLFPWQDDTVKAVGQFVESYDVRAVAWNPVYGGFIIGLLQIPAVLLMGSHLGVSGSYVTLVAHFVKAIHKQTDKLVPFLSSEFTYNDYAQLGSVFGMTFGSFLSVLVSSSPVPGDNVNNSTFSYFLGGFLLLFGARLAGGCTSGHGISGMAKLSLASVITVCCMFGGGILSANLIY